MKLDVNFDELNLAAAKMRGLDGYLSQLRVLQYPYDKALDLAIDFVKTAGGDVKTENGETTLVLNQEQAVCFQPYSDIDKFYFEI